METKWMEMLNKLHELDDRELQYVFENSMRISAERDRVRREQERKEASKAWGELVVGIQEYIKKYGNISIGDEFNHGILTNDGNTEYFTGTPGEIIINF